MKKDYRKYSESSVEETVQNNEEITEEVVEAVAEAIIEEAEEADKTIEEVVNEIVEEAVSEASNDVTELLEEGEELVHHIEVAEVTGCEKLNVRKEASKNSEVVCVITKDTELTVDLAQSTEDFYKVYTNVDDVLYEGFCVKQFINIK